MKSLILSILLVLSTAASALPGAPALFPHKRFKKVSFKPTWQRYPPPDVFLNMLRQQFPMADMGNLDSECRSLTSDNRALLGDSEPATGMPSIDNPNSSTANWYNRCLAQYVKSESQNLSYTYQTRADGSRISTEALRPRAFFNDYYSEQVVNESKGFISPSSVSVSEQIAPSKFNMAWKYLSAGARSALVRRQIERLVGPEDVVVDLGLAASEDEFVARILETVAEFIATPNAKTFVFLSINQSEYLDVNEATKIIQYLILFHDTHKE